MVGQIQRESTIEVTNNCHIWYIFRSDISRHSIPLFAIIVVQRRTSTGGQKSGNPSNHPGKYIRVLSNTPTRVLDWEEKIVDRCDTCGQVLSHCQCRMQVCTNCGKDFKETAYAVWCRIIMRHKPACCLECNKALGQILKGR